jgi:hypothetical protein
LSASAAADDDWASSLGVRRKARTSAHLYNDMAALSFPGDLPFPPRAVPPCCRAAPLRCPAVVPCCRAAPRCAVPPCCAMPPCCALRDAVRFSPADAALRDADGRPGCRGCRVLRPSLLKRGHARRHGGQSCRAHTLRARGSSRRPFDRPPPGQLPDYATQPRRFGSSLLAYLASCQIPASRPSQESRASELHPSHPATYPHPHPSQESQASQAPTGSFELGGGAWERGL